MSRGLSSSEPPKMTSPNLSSMVDFQKMVFIFGAVNDGWTTRLLDDGRYEFRKQDTKYTSDECLDGYLKDFIKFYLTLKSDKKGRGEPPKPPKLRVNKATKIE